MADESPTPEIDRSVINPDVPHQARVWNYYLGGKDNYPADREYAEQVIKAFPAIREIARHARVFLGRTVRYLAGEAGISQFLDIGTGLPTQDNTHEVAQRVNPACRIVYVDNDPLVLVHANALLTSTPEGACDYIQADVREPETILEAAAKTLDFTQPIALILLGVMATITDDEQAYEIVRRLMAGLPIGSYLVLADGSKAVDPDGVQQFERVQEEKRGYGYLMRTPQQIEGFFAGLELVEPGVVTVSQWRPEPSPWGTPPAVDGFGGVALKNKEIR